MYFDAEMQVLGFFFFPWRIKQICQTSAHCTKINITVSLIISKNIK